MAIVNKSDFPPLPPQNTKRRRQTECSDTTSGQRPQTTSSFATINDLPDELILELLDYVPGNDQEDFQLLTLLSLSLTSRRLHRIVSEKLYATYDSYLCEPYLFLRTLISNPHLAESVRHAKFRTGDGAHLGRTRYWPNAQDKKIIKEGMKALDFPDWKGWATRCNAEKVELDILHTTIMLHTPNLVSLDVEDGLISAYSRAKWPELIRKATYGGYFGHTHDFSALKSVRIDAQNMIIHHLVPLLRLQSLRQLHLRELSEIELDMRAPAELRRVLPESCNNLEGLQLEECSLRFDALTTILSSARSLKSFRFDANDESASLDGSGVVIQNALWRQRNSLESLDIYHGAYYQDDDGPSHGFKKFPALSKLKCPMRMVVDGRSGASATILEFLPPSLVSLCLFIRQCTDEENFVHLLEHMANNYAATVPKLKTVRLNVQIPADDLDYDWERLVKAFSKTGVELIIVLPEVDDEEWSDWRTMPSESDDSSNDSDEVELYSDIDSDEEL